MRKYARSRFNERGYPYWDTHSAKPLLEVDVANNMHEKMKPEQLQKTRGAYMEFPKSVFVTHVYNEIGKQKGAQFWADTCLCGLGPGLFPDRTSCAWLWETHHNITKADKLRWLIRIFIFPII